MQRVHMQVGVSTLRMSMPASTPVAVLRRVAEAVMGDTVVLRVGAAYIDDNDDDGDIPLAHIPQCNGAMCDLTYVTAYRSTLN